MDCNVQAMCQRQVHLQAWPQYDFLTCLCLGARGPLASNPGVVRAQELLGHQKAFDYGSLTGAHHEA